MIILKKILLILTLSLIICGCTGNKNNEIKKLMTENEYIIIDVRTKEEYNESHIKEAINIPYNELDESDTFDKEKIIFVYCKSGNRSKIAYDTLKKLGYTVYDLGAFKEIDLPKE